MRVFIQRSADRLYLKAPTEWVASKEDARSFASCTEAIDFCVDQRLEGVCLCLSFGDSKYDLQLDVFRAQTRSLLKENHELREKSRELLKGIDSVASETKERKKQLPFKRQELSDPDGEAS